MYDIILVDDNIIISLS